MLKAAIKTPTRGGRAAEPRLRKRSLLKTPHVHPNPAEGAAGRQYMPCSQKNSSGLSYHLSGQAVFIYLDSVPQTCICIPPPSKFPLGLISKPSFSSKDERLKHTQRAVYIIFKEHFRHHKEYFNRRYFFFPLTTPVLINHL